MFRTLILFIFLGLAACGTRQDGTPGEFNTPNQPFVINKDASLDPVFDKVIFIGSERAYQEAFRRLHVEHGACPWGYSPRVHYQREIVGGDWLANNPAEMARLLQQLRSLYGYRTIEDRMRQLNNFVLPDPTNHWWVRVTMKYRYCDML